MSTAVTNGLLNIKIQFLKMKIYLWNVSLAKEETVLVGRTPAIITLSFLFIPNTQENSSRHLIQ
jgi:hypothetical protein